MSAPAAGGRAHCPSPGGTRSDAPAQGRGFEGAGCRGLARRLFKPTP